MRREITYRHNIMNISSPETFLNIKGGFNGGRRDVYFVRVLGCEPDIERKISAIDEKMTDEMRKKRLFYTRVKSLPQLTSQTDMDFYVRQFAAFQAGQKMYLRNQDKAEKFGSVLGAACFEATELYRRFKKNMTESMEKNFIVKLLYWTDCVLGISLADWNERGIYKVLAEDVQKEQEYLFYYMLTLIGCDVLLLECRKDIETLDEIRKLSMTLKLGEFRALSLPEYRLCEHERTGVNQEGETKKSKKRQVQYMQLSESGDNIEKSFEELALLASSIVMIAVYDRIGSPVATGSGIMIGRDGYILTNNHVTAGGCFFDIRIEDDKEVYRTNEVIKYNPVLDLAVIRINRGLDPLPLYRGQKELARGQKVVAIGSPLGLFNSVSDGIISGFRKIDSVNMIQFTAPISHGSSGGAVLNMQGQIIGISTAGVNEGQNINLAVNYEDIGMFVRGFTD